MAQKRSSITQSSTRSRLATSTTSPWRARRQLDCANQPILGSDGEERMNFPNHRESAGEFPLVQPARRQECLREWLELLFYRSRQERSKVPVLTRRATWRAETRRLSNHWT